MALFAEADPTLSPNTNQRNALLAHINPPWLDHGPLPVEQESPDFGEETECEEGLFALMYSIV